MEELLARIWEDMLGRITGPMAFRLLFQPAVALFFGIRDGRKDARERRPFYLWTLFTDRSQRKILLRSGWASISKVFFVALALDAVYQFVALKQFYPGEALIVALVLAVLPYSLIRGPVNRLLRRRWGHREEAGDQRTDDRAA